MNKPETKIVLVETISMFRMRYAVEVPVGHTEFAADTVITGRGTNNVEIVELSQAHLDEVISSMRDVSKEEFLKVFREDNDYLASWSDDQIMKYVNKGYHDAD